MNYEEKYNDLLSRIKRMADVQPDVTRMAIESLFPELVESEDEDERIRKEIIDYLSTVDDKELIPYESWIAWLEKQGKQKPANKVEPKFKVKYAGSEYNVLEVKDIAGVTYYGIEDEPNHIDYVKADNCEIISGGYGIKENGSPYPTKPAVFSEHKPAWSEEDEKMYNAILRDVRNGEPLDKLQYDWLKSLKDRVQPQPKQEWSEEDESCLITIINELEASKSVSKYETKTYDKLLNWLKSLCPQKKQEWSKDDEILLEGIIGAVSNKKLLNKYQIEWLSNLSPQSHWKPSEEQMDTLKYYMHALICTKYKEILFGLYSDLKKLRKE